MKIGKLPEPVLIRSVLKQVKHRREEVLVGPAVGQDCAALEVGEDEVKYNASLHFLYRHVDIITLLSCTLSGSDCIYQKRSQQFIHALLTSYIIHFIYFAASQTSFPSLNTISFIS